MDVTRVYRLIWTSDVGFSGMDERDFPTLEAAQAEATEGLTWRVWQRDEWKSTVDKYGDIFTIVASYRY